MSDFELLQRYVRQRDQEAFAEIVRRYIDLVYSTARRRVGTNELAEDVTQNVFFLLARKAGKISEKVVLAGWLFRAAQFAAGDAMKAEQRRRRRDELIECKNTVEPAAEWEEISPVLEAAMDRLPPADRNAILLRYFRGMEIGDVAAAMELPAGTATKRVQRAIEKLRQGLAERGINSPGDVIGAALIGNAVRPAPAGLAGKIYGTTPAAATISTVITTGVWAKVLAVVVIVAGVGTAVAVHSNSKESTIGLNPDSAAQEQMIRASIWRLRHYAIGTKIEQWAGAIRTLIEIGRPAVPELVAELDRTGKHQELRALAFVLRNIGDARAVPALIGALRRVDLAGSNQSIGYGVSAATLKFMQAHEANPPGQVLDAGWQYFAYPTADVQILAALETITHHHAGQLHWYQQIPSQEYQALVNLWQAWWDANQSRLVSPVKMASLAATKHDPESIDAAGVLAFGPIVPTGKPYHLSAVQEQTAPIEPMRDWPLDSPSLVNFYRTPAVFSELDALRWIPRDFKASDGFTFYTRGAQVDCYAGEQYPLKPKSKYAFQNSIAWWCVAGLDGSLCDIEVWQAPDSMWDELPKLVESGKPVPLDPNGPNPDFEWDDPVTHQYDPEHWPETFIVRTRTGGVAIVQILEPRKPQEVRFRFRVIEPHPTGFAPPPPIALPAAGEFSQVHTVRLGAPDSDDLACAIDLNTGKLFACPEPERMRVTYKPPNTTDPKRLEWERDKENQKDTARQRWINQCMAAVHANAVTYQYLGNKISGLRFLGIAEAKISAKTFDTISPGLVQAALDHLATVAPETQGSAENLSSIIFRTAKGTEGVLQIESTSDRPPILTLRYKIIAARPLR